jgi:hypothetical protein
MQQIAHQFNMRQLKVDFTEIFKLLKIYLSIPGQKDLFLV